jgi:phenylacetate-CoA ligase
VAGTYYDDLEIRDPAAREGALMAALGDIVALAKVRAPAYAELLRDVEPRRVTSREALAQLPVTRKSALPEQQKAAPPFGGFAAGAAGEMARIFSSPGPIYEPEGWRPDYWRFARALHANGFRRGDVLHNCFSYHFTPAGMMLESGAHALGCAVFPAGVGNTEQQVHAIAHVRPVGYSGTPDFLKVILDKGDEVGADLSSIRRAHVSGGALLPDVKSFYHERGIAVFQSYGTADLGLIAYESEAHEGLILDESVIVEIVRPGTGDPVVEGEVGEVVVTALNPDYPLIRFATGDLSAFMPERSACGRTNKRLRGWMGRADQTTKVKGMFVHPAQVAEILKRHGLESRARLEVDREGGNDVMLLRVEAEGPEALEPALEASLQAVTKLRGRVRLVPPGTLPNDGKVIADLRKYG